VDESAKDHNHDSVVRIVSHAFPECCEV